MYRELTEEYNVYTVGFGSSPPESIFTNRALRTLNDFQGLKVRTPSGLTADLFAKLGASPTPVSGGELYTALSTGVIDAAEWISVTENYDAGLAEVVDYVLWPSFHTSVALVDIGVNLDEWNALPDDLKACWEAAATQFADYYWYTAYAKDFETIENMKAMGIEHTQLSAADFEEVRGMSMEVAQDYKAKSPLSAKVIDSMLNFMRYIGELE
jgi:TRAP-type mannitol/chloroaromatic compound transport system substrate-binding protein